jgi:propanediol utilization protein
MSPKKIAEGNNFKISFISMYQKDNKLGKNEKAGKSTGIIENEEKSGVSIGEPIININMSTHEVSSDGYRIVNDKKIKINEDDFENRRVRQKKITKAQIESKKVKDDTEIEI